MILKKILAMMIKIMASIIFALFLTACGKSGEINVVIRTEEPSPSYLPIQSATPEAEPTLTPEPTPVSTIDHIDQLILRMSDRELIGQMVMIGVNGTEDIDDESIALIQEYNVGNVILFGWNTGTFSQTEQLIEKINFYNHGEIPMLVGIDVEGGSVTRFKRQWSPSLNSAQKLGEINDPERVYEQYKQIGEQLADVGINIDFAPVLDIAKDPSSTFLGEDKRMFGSNPDKVSALVRQAVTGLHDGGVASLGKHFPGHGDTASDSHKTLPVINATLEEMRGYSLVPFQAAVNEGIDAMLVAHLSYPNLDGEYITSVSPYVITDILREELGFDGVVFSDDMRMQGLSDNYPVGEASVLFILAGGDIVLIGKNNDMQAEIFKSLNKATEDGTISRERLEESVRRILEMKMKYCSGS